MKKKEKEYRIGLCQFTFFSILLWGLGWGIAGAIVLGLCGCSIWLGYAIGNIFGALLMAFAMFFCDYKDDEISRPTWGMVFGTIWLPPVAVLAILFVIASAGALLNLARSIIGLGRRS